MSVRRWLSGARVRAGARLIGGAAILALVVAEVGAQAFIDGVRATTGSGVVGALALGLASTSAAAWRWRIVARGVGVAVPLGAAVAGYYRAQFLNTVLPGGLLGDVHRGVAHGRSAGDVGRGLRAVAWERAAGQAVLFTLTGVAVAVAARAIPGLRPAAVGAGAAAVAAVGVLGFLASSARAWAGESRLQRAASAVRYDLRRGVFAPDAWPGVLLSSALVTAAHGTTFWLAAHATGVPLAAGTAFALGLLCISAMAIPLNLGGWGPREGMAAWVFGAAGLSAAQGVTTAAAYGVLVFVACLPGAAVLVVEAWTAVGRDRGAREAAVPGADRLLATLPSGAARRKVADLDD